MPVLCGNNQISPADQESTSTSENTRVSISNGPSQERSSFVYHGQLITLSNTGSSVDINCEPRKQSWQEKAMTAFSKATCMFRCFGLTFQDENLEKFYKIYSNKQKALDFGPLLVFSICISFALILVTALDFSPNWNTIAGLVVVVVCLLITIIVSVVAKKALVTGSTVIALSYLIWFLILLQLVAKLLLSSAELTANGYIIGDTTSWFLLLTYFTYVALPAKRAVSGGLALVVTLLHNSIIVTRCYLSSTCFIINLLKIRVAANAILYMAVNILGYTTAYLSERNQRRSFLEIKESIIANAFIEKQLLKQEDLLMSVLPRHIASNLMQDVFDDTKEQRFRKMYMTRHENVSILFADIVGFTTLSSIKSAREVCSLLNQLFTTFDDLAEKYHQLRIKILGDCYYCISGAPEPRSDHAVLCVHMGLEICEAIKTIRQSMGNCNVDMRVGIHSGKVLGGVIGQKQWQYDVMSKEVNVANQMETYGTAGRVHISQTVTLFLNGQFELEEQPPLPPLISEGNNMKTYIVTSVISKFPAGTLDENINSVNMCDDYDTAREKPTNKTSDQGSDQSVNTRLNREMLEMDVTDGGTLGKSSTITLWFEDTQLETAYRQKEILRCGISMFAIDLVLVINLCVNCLLHPRSWVTIVCFVSAAVLILPLRILSLGSHLPDKLACAPSSGSCMCRVDKYRHILTAITTVLAYTAHVAGFYFTCHRSDSSMSCSCSTNDSWSVTKESFGCEGQLVVVTDSVDSVEFFIIGITLILVATHLLNHIGFIIRATFMVLLAVTCSLIIVFKYGVVPPHTLSLEQGKVFAIEMSTTAACTVIGVAVILSSLSYQREKTFRRLFLSRMETNTQREKIGSIREVNQKLVDNILPPYIASQFLNMHDGKELYSESYDDVAVMFIAIPQFESFYSEEHYNNDGLECIRFLNEIISDFDEVLNQDRFKNVAKIKTIGSTYMVAVGMEDDKAMFPTSHVTRKSHMEVDINTVDSFSLDFDSGYESTRSMTVIQRHLVTMVELALALRNQMDSINEQSFNTFMLQIGLNYGPVIGGVIGSRKPHFDIWGNTVNVASRMQTTGVPGKIQLTSESEEQLREVSPYQFEPRGLVTVKGKGRLATFLLDCSPKTENSYLWT